MDYLSILIPVFIAIIISLLLEKIFGKGERIDRGFVLCFWKLSYRRKFFRTLWMLPIAVLAILLVYLTRKSFSFTVFVGVILSIMLIVEAVYYYRKWKAEE